MYLQLVVVVPWNHFEFSRILRQEFQVATRGIVCGRLRLFVMDLQLEVVVHWNHLELSRIASGVPGCHSWHCLQPAQTVCHHCLRCPLESLGTLAICVRNARLQRLALSADSSVVCPGIYCSRLLSNGIAGNSSEGPEPRAS